MSRSIIQKGRYCYLCALLDGDESEKSVLQEHHVFGGPLRKKSEHYGLKVYLCLMHHEGDINGCREAVHRPEYNDYGEILKKIGQEKFEELHGHDEWMAEFGKNYLDSDRNSDGNRAGGDYT